MWPHNSFGINGPFPSGFNQEDFLYPPKTFQNSSGPLDHNSSTLPPDNLSDIGNANAQSYHGFTKNSFQSEPDVLNQSKQGQNSHAGNPIVQCTSRPLSNVQASNLRPSAPQISSRAAELKAQLLARRANPSNSPGINSITKSDINDSVNGARQDISQAPNSISKPSSTPSISENQDKPLNLSDLILQYSDSKSRAEAKKNQEVQKSLENNENTTVKPNTPVPIPPRESQAPTSKNTPLAKKNGTVLKKKSNNKLINKECGRKVDTKVSDPETSEGEIIENVDMLEDASTGKLKEVPLITSVSRNEERPSRTSFMDLTTSAYENSGPSEGSILQSSGSPTSPNQIHSTLGCKPTYTNQRSDDKNYPVGPRSEQKTKPVPERQNQSRHDTRMDEIQKSEVCIQSGRTEPGRQKQLLMRERESDRESRTATYPALQDVLLHDVDLKEWLEITGFNNKPYRDKILGRRRAIAALDAQREKLIAEIEAEERGGIPIQSQPFSSSMLPPPIPISKPGERFASTPTTSNISNVPYERHNIASNKRSFSQSQDYSLENGPGKIARTDNINYSQWAKDDLSFDSRRPRSSGHDNGSRQILDHYDDLPRANANSSRESPIFVASERKSPSRINGYENDPYDEDEISETGTRSLEGRRNHRGRAFDSKHRGRGRARGRGEIRDSRDSPEPRSELSSSSLKTANSRPNKASRAASRGSRGNH
ncbi:hypothetical protein OnM2_093026 [Erysiphe neolycopersici]|uniref:Uncharacterized protein n=1 Tax=Erysiphe neolycopersici TaxID=212602 RepID=A0A420HBY3_9PEZI|nr:hypothetical protein OnM2_093026 [Erysiphe neolycopersici]